MSVGEHCHRVRAWLSAIVRCARLAVVVAVGVVAGTEPTWAERVDVVIDGVEGPLAKNVEVVLSIMNARDADDLTARDIQRLHERAPGEIELALQPFGFYRPSIDSSLEPVPDENRIVARYVIDPGDPIRVERVDVHLEGDGTNDPEVVESIEAFPLRPGDVLLHAPYEAAKADIAFVTADNGYFDAVFDSTAILIDLDAYTANVVMRVDTGPRYRFGEVTLEQDVVDPKVLRGYVDFEPGDPYEVEKLLQLQTNLSQGPYFSSVSARPRRDLADGLEIPIEVSLTSRKPQRFEVGAGYGTDTGARGSFKVELRRLNRRGHRAEADVTVSEIERAVSTRYLIPGFHPSTALYSIFAGYSNYDVTSNNGDKWVVGTSVSHGRWGWRETIALTYEHETYEVGVDRGTSDLLIPSVDWSRVEADDPIVPRRGWRLRFDVRGSHEDVLSSATFLQVRGEGKLVRGLGDRTRFIGRIGAGRSFTSAFRELPASLRFFAGGEGSVRGYELRSLSPEDDAGNDIGGQMILDGGVEIERRLFGSWGVAAFTDAGNALHPDRSTDLEVGAGLGLRWWSPVGLVRVDGAYGFARERVRLHLMIGPDL